MSLYSIYKSEKEAQYNSIYKRYHDEIMASYDIFDVTISSMENKRIKERTEIFLSDNTYKMGYHFIYHFATEYFIIKDKMIDTFDLAFQNAKLKVYESYKSHDYLPKIIEFLEQEDKEILKKIALLHAYDEINESMFKKDIEKLKSKFEILRCGNLSNEKLDRINEIIHHHLNILSGNYKNKATIDKEGLQQLIKNCQLLIIQPKNVLEENIEIQTYGLPNYFIRCLFNELYISLKNEEIKQPEFRKNMIEFIRKSFKKIGLENSETTYKKFKDSPSQANYNKIKRELQQGINIK